VYSLLFPSTIIIVYSTYYHNFLQEKGAHHNWPLVTWCIATDRLKIGPATLYVAHWLRACASAHLRERILASTSGLMLNWVLSWQSARRKESKCSCFVTWRSLSWKRCACEQNAHNKIYILVKTTKSATFFDRVLKLLPRSGMAECSENEMEKNTFQIINAVTGLLRPADT
jgi:hypothetical protein